MRILVTGDTGFVGKNMTQFLSLKGMDVTGISRSKGLDILKYKQLEEFIKSSECELIYHFAAYAKPAESLLHPKEAWKTNVIGTLNILEVARKLDIPLIYPSSCEIYGDSLEPITEDFPLHPPNPYAGSKAAADLLCYTYYKSYGLDVKIVRIFNPYGPHQQLNKIIPTFYRQAIKNMPITVYGDGRDTRDYVYIEDIIRGLWMARNLPKGEIINLATGRATTNLEMAQLIKKLVNSKSPIVFVDYPKNFGGIKNQVGSYEKAKRLIGWTPEISLEEGVKRTILWLSEVFSDG